MKFNRKSEQLRVPLSGSIELTRRCNLKCVHCYVREARDDGKREMDTGRILSIIDEITEAGCLNLLLTGGEPLLRKDFGEIYRHAKENGLIVTVFTNGTLVTEKNVDLFKAFPPRVVEISMYGATAPVYEKVTGIAGSYEQCMDGVRRLIEKKVRVGLKTILMTINRHEFFALEDIAQDFGIKFRFDAAIFPRLNGDKAPMHLRVSPQEAVEKEFSDMERARKWEEYYARSRGQAPNDGLYNCGAGITSFHIDPYGNLQPCIMPAGLNYDVSQGGFRNGWYGIIARIKEKKAGRAYQCNKCEKRHLCGFCPAFSRLECGMEDVYSEYLCSIGNQRFQRIRKFDLQGAPNAT